jgi:hypothetical protein
MEDRPPLKKKTRHKTVDPTKNTERLENWKASSTGLQNQHSAGKKGLATQGTRVHIAVSAAKKKSLMRQPEQKSKGSLQLEKQQNPKSATGPTPAEKVRGVEKTLQRNWQDHPT